MTKPTRKETDKLARAKSQGQAQFDSIYELVQRLEAARKASDSGDGRQTHSDDVESAEQAIQEDTLSVQVRSGWYSPGSDSKDIMRQPCEYEILLCTGGPACRIVGKLDDYNQPETATMEVQDWFTPWTAIQPNVTQAELETVDHFNAEEIMLAYARCFYFGEG